MTCAEVGRLLDAYLDDELDLRSALEVEEHLAGCAECGNAERRLRELSRFAREHLTRHAPPPALEQRLRQGLRPARPARRFRNAAVLLVPVAAAALLLVVAGPRFLPGAAEARLEDAVVAAHVRSLLADHLTDVASSDQHTVKPWFQGKLDYSVPVTDFSAQGFPLLGGRLDYLQDMPAAALVYQRRKHVVNLFIWPGGRGEDGPVRLRSIRGYGAFRWTQEGMNHWAVSDLNEAELRELVELVRQKR